MVFKQFDVHLRHFWNPLHRFLMFLAEKRRFSDQILRTNFSFGVFFLAEFIGVRRSSPEFVGNVFFIDVFLFSCVFSRFSPISFFFATKSFQTPPGFAILISRATFAHFCCQSTSFTVKYNERCDFWENLQSISIYHWNRQYSWSMPPNFLCLAFFQTIWTYPLNLAFRSFANSNQVVAASPFPMGQQVSTKNSLKRNLYRTNFNRNLYQKRYWTKHF